MRKLIENARDRDVKGSKTSFIGWDDLQRNWRHWLKKAEQRSSRRTRIGNPAWPKILFNNTGTMANKKDEIKAGLETSKPTISIIQESKPKKIGFTLEAARVFFRWQGSSMHRCWMDGRKEQESFTTGMDPGPTVRFLIPDPISEMPFSSKGTEEKTRSLSSDWFTDIGMHQKRSTRFLNMSHKRSF